MVFIGMLILRNLYKGLLGFLCAPAKLWVLFVYTSVQTLMWLFRYSYP
jgi:hypothetical protein